ncbi:unnamed protein product, partial [Staurois parvus]
VSCDWSQLVTWYKAVVNSLVPCDLCDHSQISHVVSNDVTSDILLTTLHVITDSPISDHMTGTSYRGPVRRSALHWWLYIYSFSGAAADYYNNIAIFSVQ